MAKSLPHPIAALLTAPVAIAQESGSANPITSDGPGGEFILDRDGEVGASEATGIGPNLVSVYKGTFWFRSWVRARR